MINWDALNKDDVSVIQRIAKRAVTDNPNLDFLNLTMDVSAVHIKNPLDLNRFESFDDLNFTHDVYGIMRHIDRNTGELKDCFLPRCTAKGDSQ